jgi:SAM-dependent methyltransferase
VTNVDLAAASDVDFAKIHLTFDGFRRLAINPNLSVHGRIGFPDSYRDRYEEAIFDDIRRKLPPLAGRGQTVLDIGPGCANLPRMMMDLCAERGHRLYLIDSPEMLAQLPDAPHVRRVEGAFPDRMPVVNEMVGDGVDALLCYSVLHYLFVESNPFHVVDTIVQALAPGGIALLGDIPNASKRKRFFSTAAGQAYHRAFAGGAPPPAQTLYETQLGRIDDSVLLAMMQRAQLAGCDAYLLPQPDTLPMFNRRDDLVIRKP